ncbi:hypothetical protein PTI98_013281 [Pleurotus ostreatus]|nr:hypothetical protein PTI98_013281 [Pleurotus ostreatus]
MMDTKYITLIDDATPLEIFNVGTSGAPPRYQPGQTKFTRRCPTKRKDYVFNHIRYAVNYDNTRRNMFRDDSSRTTPRYTSQKALAQVFDLIHVLRTFFSKITQITKGQDFMTANGGPISNSG